MSLTNAHVEGYDQCTYQDPEKASTDDAQVVDRHVQGVFSRNENLCLRRKQLDISGIVDTIRRKAHVHLDTVLCRRSDIEVRDELRVGIDVGLEEGPVLTQVPGVDVEPTLEGRLILRYTFLRLRSCVGTWIRGTSPRGGRI